MLEKTHNNLSFFALGLLCGSLVASIVFAAVCASGNASSPGESSPKRVLKLAHGLESTHPVHLGMIRMKEIAEKLSGGTLSIDRYSGGALGSEIKCTEQVRNGSLDMAKNSSSPLSVHVPELGALAMPYLFRDSEHYWKVLDSQIGKNLLKAMEKKGFVGLCFYDAGARSFYTVKKPVEKPGDLVGLKIRVMNSRSDIALMKAFGAAPTVISAGETYTSLAQGVVDGAENNIPTYLAGAHFEVAKFFTLDEHTRIPDVLFISAQTWRSLSEKEREILQRAAEESSKYQRRLWNEKTMEAKAELERKGVKFITPKESFESAASSVYEDSKDPAINAIISKIKAVK